MLDNRFLYKTISTKILFFM